MSLLFDIKNFTGQDPYGSHTIVANVSMYAPQNNTNKCQLIPAGLILEQRYVTKKVACIKIAQIEHRIPIENGISWGIGE
jgi:hypothetical protein